MSSIEFFIAAILIGFVGLIWSADRFVEGSAAIAQHFGMSKLLIGLTIVSLGTSAPEIVVSTSAALQGAGELAVGNALGSNLANIGMVLGITALIAPLPIKGHILRQELPVLILVTLLAGYLLYDAQLALTDGLILAGSLALLMFVTFKYKKSHPSDEGDDIEMPDDMAIKAAIIWFAIGLSVLIASSELLVWGATNTALLFDVSPLIIGLTVVAIGTSLPELAATVMSALKGHHDIAIGNIIGSNVFNLLAVMAVPGLIATTALEPQVFSRDYLAMLAITLLLVLAIFVDYCLGKPGKARLGRLVGLLLISAYGGYYWLLSQSF